ncbi:hypothetical protein LCGC14_3012830 [marine sediment metagenome]|uniref:Uncharacterized protein n=1 Tax=marine sediment metagenome TaxID=412755 RepID=A0A0F8WXL3_9ZZZZ
MPKRKLQRKYTVAWLIWGASFLAIEGVALMTSEGGDTLSEQVWSFQEHVGSVGFASVFALLGWLVWHFSPLEKARKRLGPKDG